MSEEQQLNAASINKVAKLAQDAQLSPIKLVRPESEPSDVYLIVNERTGKHDRLIAEPPKLTLAAEGTSAIIEFVKAASDESPTVYYSANRIDATKIDSNGRRHAIGLNLPTQDAYRWLCGQSVDRAEVRPQRAFVNILRVIFRDAIPVDVIKNFRKVVWRADAETESAVAHNANSLGKKINATVSGESAIPEEMTLHIGVFDISEALAARYPVRVAVEAHHESKGFLMIPVANDLHKVRAQALEDLMARIRSAIPESVPVIYADPS